MKMVVVTQQLVARNSTYFEFKVKVSRDFVGGLKNSGEEEDSLRF